MSKYEAEINCYSDITINELWNHIRSRMDDDSEVDKYLLVSASDKKLTMIVNLRNSSHRAVIENYGLIKSIRWKEIA